MTERRSWEEELTRRFPALRKLRLGRRRKRIPYVQQVSAADCGAACLAMVLGYHGNELSLEEVRTVTGFGRDGANALTLLKAGRWFRLRGRGLKVENLEDLKHVPPASILHWGFNHFVVFSRLTKDGAEILDPAIGRRVVSEEELNEKLTGVILTFEPSEEFEPGTSGSQTIWRYLKTILQQSGLLSRILVTSLLVQIFAIAVPFLIGVLVDRVVPQRDVPLLTVLAVGLAGIVGFNFIAVLLRAHLFLHLRTRLDARLTLDFLDHLVSLPYSFFQERSSGDLIMRLNSNSTIREILTSAALSTLLDGTLVLLYLVVLLISSWQLGLLVVVLGAARLAVYFASRRKHRELMSESLQADAKSQSYQVQMLSGIETLKTSGTENRAVEHWSNLYVDVLNVSLARGRLDATVQAILGGLGMLSPALLLLVGAVLVLNGSLSLGTMLAVNALAAGFLTPLSSLVSTAFKLQVMSSYLERINDVLETPAEQTRDKIRVERLHGAIELDEVSFQYGPLSPLVVRDVSVEIAPGSVVALVGRSGAGKSTLAHLMVGLYEPTSGSILYDGFNLRELDLRSLRSKVGVVSQFPYIFGGTFFANIAMSDPTVPFARVDEAARLAKIREDILAMPLGYYTLLADGGASLSGGQRQRLALARALLSRPSILLLDEATRQLDAITESRINQELEKLHCTRVIIAHRLSTIRNADLILVMEDGKVVERGDHQALLDQDGVYAELVARQLEKERMAQLQAL